METVPLANVDAFAQKVLDILQSLEQNKPHATLVALRGDLGSGKTTFVQALAKALGVTETLQSPTYVLMKSYDIPQGVALKSPGVKATPFNKLVHIDAYRLENPKQFAAIKPEQFLQDPKILVCVEWPERVECELPKPDLVINFSSEGMQEGERSVEVEK
ncbi:MAG: tRNA (adenosine(37)-N6)-threonylcarbamoyltransferase complex ATPase subunit type 1 TsaE [Minisyncoccia bacterium]|jgi:tRNA threonylcarbamoyladenosine biosynthesis protein TsaE